jgi:hypothetical protein
VAYRPHICIWRISAKCPGEFVATSRWRRNQNNVGDNALAGQRMAHLHGAAARLQTTVIFSNMANLQLMDGSPEHSQLYVASRTPNPAYHRLSLQGAATYLWPQHITGCRCGFCGDSLKREKGLRCEKHFAIVRLPRNDDALRRSS